ncbi:MAG: hypothetical protein LBP29_04230 [Treponema sp.]|jgi:hypothetical protein|nr:hypothetical protein [Treponema sp.]
MKNPFPLVVLLCLYSPCLYPQVNLPSGETGASFGGERPSPAAGHGAFFHDTGFSGLFRVPDFEKPRITNFADSSGSYSTETGKAGSKAASAETSSLPRWLKDLRRAEIVAFGSFPLTIFWTTFFMDVYRTASHGWDNRYAPWPFKGAGAVGMTNREVAAMFTIAISSSLAIAVVDHFIMRYRRSKAEEADPQKPVRLDKMPGEPSVPPQPIIIPEG